MSVVRTRCIFPIKTLALEEIAHKSVVLHLCIVFLTFSILVFVLAPLADTHSSANNNLARRVCIASRGLHPSDMI